MRLPHRIPQVSTPCRYRVVQDFVHKLCKSLIRFSQMAHLVPHHLIHLATPPSFLWNMFSLVSQYERTSWKEPSSTTAFCISMKKDVETSLEATCDTYSPADEHGTPKLLGCRGKYSSTGQFSGSMLVWGSITLSISSDSVAGFKPLPGMPSGQIPIRRVDFLMCLG